MGFLIDEKRFINENIFKFEERMESQYTRFLDKTPTFVTYYNINNVESTTDSGLFNVEEILGPNSPIKFRKVKDLPIYGIESILLDLNEEDEGLTTSFESDGTILPNTLKPYPNDFFTISYLNKNYLFSVNSVSFDYIKSNNFYKIVFHVRSLTEDQAAMLETQTNENYSCIFRNIGTEDKCIIRDDEFKKIMDLNTVYKKIADKYRVIFYNKKYNSFVFRNDNTYIYDIFLTHFINKNQIMNERYNFNSLYVELQDNYPSFELDYEYSLLRTLERCDKAVIDHITSLQYSLKPVTEQWSIFNYFLEDAKSVSFLPQVSMFDYIPASLIQRIQTNTHDIHETILEKMIIDFFNKTVKSISEVDTVHLDSMMDYFRNDFTTFLYIPIALFILRQYYFGFMGVNK